MPEKTPQDRKKKAAKATAYTFTANGESYTLPPAHEAANKISGRTLRNASLNGEEGQLALGFATLEAAGASEDAINALYDMPAPEMLEHIAAWMGFKAAAEDASLGESLGSST